MKPRWIWQSVQQVWIGWRVKRLTKAGAYDDPITTRRRLAKAARFEDEFRCPDCDGETCSVCGGCLWGDPKDDDAPPCGGADHEWC